MFLLKNIHEKVYGESEEQFLLFALVREDGTVLANSEGLFFEDIIVTSDHGTPETQSIPIFSDVAQIGVLKIVTTLTSIGNPPKALQ